MRRLFLDLTPLRESRDFRRLWTGLTLGNVGQQVAIMTISLQVYSLTGSSFSVGLVSLCALVPLVTLGLYGGAVVDAYDRRKVSLGASTALWLVALATASQAWLGIGSVHLLYALVALQSSAFAIANPARAAIIPRLVRRELLPAANALHTVGTRGALAVGPMLAGLLVAEYGYAVAYTVDVVTYTVALWSTFRLPSLLPEGEVRRAGIRSVLEGLRFLRTRRNVRMTFLADMTAMVLAQPRVLFPAVGAVVIGGGASTVGFLAASIATGSVLATLSSGPLSTVRRQGLVVLVCVALWGACVVGFGLVLAMAPRVDSGAASWALWPAAGFLAAAGACDAVSAILRTTILQVATPDSMRGRLQGVFLVVVQGGPRLGDLLTGTTGEALGEVAAAIAGGVVCVLVVIALARWQPGFLRYDSRRPEP